AIWNKRYTRARTNEGRMLARLNSVHLADEEYFTVVDPFKAIPGQGPPPVMGGPAGNLPPAPSSPVPPLPPTPPPIPQGPEVEQVQVGRMDYLEDTDILITADPRMASQPQRFQ